MKPVLFKIAKTEEESIKVLEEDFPHFYDNFHYHSENQIMIILEGKGTYFIGDAIGDFCPGDVFILGAELPHFFRSDREYYANGSSLRSKNISVLFSMECLGENMLNLPEMHPVKKVLHYSKKGLKAGGKMKKDLYRSGFKFKQKEGLGRIIYLFKILDKLSRSNELEPLSHITYENSLKFRDPEKVNTVINYLMGNFTKDISLSDVADVANLSVNAFCRFFKHHTRKTFTQFLNEIRIGHACKQLIEEGDSIKEVAFDCGYYNISYFNRQFKLITGYTPSEYLKMHNHRDSIAC